MQEWDGLEYDKIGLLLRLISNKQYDEPVGRCCVELAQEIRELLKQAE